MSLKLPNFKNIHALVVGDVMLDYYWQGAVSRISPEAPVPIVPITKEKTRPGAAANVALCLQALGCTVTLCSLVGQDTDSQTLTHHLRNVHINCQFITSPQLNTIKKLRILDNTRHQQLIRLDFENTLPYHTFNKDLFYKQYCQQLPQADVVILSDYAKGVLSDPQPFIQAARKASLPIFVDPKSLDFKIYQGATSLTPNQREFLGASGINTIDTQATLIKQGYRLATQNNLQSLLITQGEKGMTLIEIKKNPHTQKTPPNPSDIANSGISNPDIPYSKTTHTPTPIANNNFNDLHLPACVSEIYDVTGAGDTVIAVFATSYAAGASLADAAALANIAAGCAVNKLGTATVSDSELQQALQDQQGLPRSNAILTQNEVIHIVKEAQSHKKRIVFTNGCFDILHAGHITYLEQAKALGDYLIVAVNSDASVARLKGPDRPFNPLDCRMRLLSSLRCIDWVVSFDEDTPKHLIEKIKPDILVKGGDYAPHDIAGADSVQRSGGQVRVLDFVPGFSTTRLIEKIVKTTND